MRKTGIGTRKNRGKENVKNNDPRKEREVDMIKVWYLSKVSG